MERQSETLLIAEADNSVRDALHDLLRLEGYRVELVEEGLAALDRLTRDGIDLLIVDLHLPRLDGYDVCRWLRRQSATRGLPIVALGTGVVETVRPAALAAGASHFLSMPFEIDSLLASVQILFARRDPLCA